MKALISILSVFVLSSCSVVGPGERGIRFHFGKASDEVQSPGAYVYFPFFAGMTKVNVQVQKSEVEASAASKDMQEIVTHVAVNWSISPDKVVTIFKNVGNEDDILKRIIIPAVNETTKQAAAQRTAEDALIHRLDMKKDIDLGLKDRLAGYGITLHDVSIVNFKFSDEFTKAIERKQIAEQRAKESEYEAQQAIQKAKAAANLAKGEAEATLTRAKAEAEAQKLLKMNLTKEVLNLEYLKKWNGALSTVLTGSGSGVMLNMSAANKKE